MKLIILIGFLFFNLSAKEKTTCIEKLNQLQNLKSQKASVVENVAAYMLSWNAINFSKREDEKNLEYKIRILEIELKSCKSMDIK